MRRNNVASTAIQRYFGTKCPLGLGRGLCSTTNETFPCMPMSKDEGDIVYLPAKRWHQMYRWASHLQSQGTDHPSGY